MNIVGGAGSPGPAGVTWRKNYEPGDSVDPRSVVSLGGKLWFAKRATALTPGEAGSDADWDEFIDFTAASEAAAGATEAAAVAQSAAEQAAADRAATDEARGLTAADRQATQADRTAVSADRALTVTARSAAEAARDGAVLVSATGALPFATLNDFKATAYLVGQISSGLDAGLWTRPDTATEPTRVSTATIPALDNRLNVVEPTVATLKQTEKTLPFVGFAEYSASATKHPLVVDTNKRMHGYWDQRIGKLVYNLDLSVFPYFRSAQLSREVDVAGSRYFPLAVLESGRLAISYDMVDNTIVIPSLRTDSAIGVGASVGGGSFDVALPADLDFGVYDAVASLWMIPLIGQSTTEGSKGDPPFSDAQPFFNLSWPQGPKTRKTGNGYGGDNNLDPMVAVAPLAEKNVETVCSGALNTLVDLAWRRKGIAPASFPLFGATCGRGGTGIDLFQFDAPLESGRTQRLSQILMDTVTGLDAIESRDLVAPVFLDNHGEFDKLMPKAEYKAKKRRYFDQIGDYLAATIGQSKRPHFVMCQPGEGITAADGGPAQAMYELSMEHDDCHLLGGKYHQPDADFTHLINHGYRRLSVEFGYSLYDLLVDRIFPRRCKMVSATWNGFQIVTRWEVRKAPLQFDVTTLNPATDMGLRLVTAAGVQIPFTAQPTIGNDGVTMYHSVAAEPPAGAIMRCGFDYRASGIRFTQGASTNIRDSTEEAFVYLDNNDVLQQNVMRCWAAHCMVPVVKGVY